jgi:GGDEF domain-containing protein
MRSCGALVSADHQLGPISLSVGIAVFPEDGASTEAVLQAADRALISSRQAGRNGVAMGQAAPSWGEIID